MQSVTVHLLFFLFFTQMMEDPKRFEHLDQLTAAEPDIWTRPDQRKRPISVIYLSSLIFSRNHAFSGCYALLATSDAALLTMKKQQNRNAGAFFLALVTCHVTSAVRTLGHDV